MQMDCEMGGVLGGFQRIGISWPGYSGSTSWDYSSLGLFVIINRRTEQAECIQYTNVSAYSTQASTQTGDPYLFIIPLPLADIFFLGKTFKDFHDNRFFLLFLFHFEGLAAAVGYFFECFEVFFDEFDVFYAEFGGDDGEVAEGVDVAWREVG